MVRVHVTRAFLYRGKPQEIGSEMEVSPSFAAELVATNKAVLARPVPATTMTTQSAETLVRGKPASKEKP